MPLVQLKESVVFDDQDDEGVILNSSTGCLFTLNPVATVILRTCLRYEDEDAAVVDLAEQIDADKTTVLHGIRHLVHQLEEAQLLEQEGTQ